MGFWGKLFGGGGKAVGEAAKGTLEGIGSAATGIRSAITGEIPPEKRAELERHARELEQAVQTMQMEVNKAEANQGHWFISTWRPAMGHVCVLAVAYHFLFRPLAIGFGLVAEMPSIEIGQLWPVVMGMLGLGGMRSWEKGKGVQDKH